MDKTFRYGVILLLCLNLVWAAMFIARSLSAPRPAAETRPAGLLDFSAETKYTLYVGTNDKDTYTRLVSLEEAKERLDAAAMRHVDGFTVRQARGFWKDEKGVPTHEDTLVYDFVGATEEQVSAIARDMLKAMNQNSILIEKNETRGMFFSHTESGLVSAQPIPISRLAGRAYRMGCDEISARPVQEN